MIKFNEIDLDYEPRKKVISKVPPEFFAVEMSEFESAFLCGVLKKFKPKKIVEVGVAAGGTTSIILQALEDIGQKYKMDSIELRENVYNDVEKKSGFIAEYIIPENKNDNFLGIHNFHRGTILPSVIEKIGNDIDFVILDTTHVVPGEILDFLTVFPYLSKNAIIVMHDVSLCQRFKYSACHSTSVLLSSVVADKFLNYQPEYIDMIYTYPNIAAFQINEQTKENIGDVFLTLILRWPFYLDRNHIRAYYDILKKNYSNENCKIFEEALKMNYLNLRVN